jgi:Icc-related predicted phosphoesterase
MVGSVKKYSYNNKLIIDCISDLHGHRPELKGGGLLIVAGDLTANHSMEEYIRFLLWLEEQDYQKKIVIGGNHDEFFLKDHGHYVQDSPNTEYLCDSGTEYEGFKIWGSPWTTKFKGMNPRCMAFTVDTDKELKKKWDLIPDDTNILITHSPPYGIHDEVLPRGNSGGFEHVGSSSLLERIGELESLKLHVFGHTHPIRNSDRLREAPVLVNAACVDNNYRPMKKYTRVFV